ncbi:MAG TPA: DUF5691 domain-containing protein, partial [Chroococcales cyanobacterium]
MSAWNDLLAVALLGTNNQKLGLLSESGALGAMLSDIQKAEQRSPERVILDAVATMSLHRTAGRAPESASQSVAEPAPDETLPSLINLTTFHVQQLLDEYRGTILPAWLEAVAESEKRIPHLFLPDFLAAAARNVNLRERLAPILGERGRWLAAQNQVWRDVVIAAGDCFDEEKLKQLFETGALEERLQALRTLRLKVPQLAVQLIESVWMQDSYQHRSLFLETLSTNLSISDEPFLEDKGLSDKRKEIRTVAANLLARLPESRLHRRMLERLEPLIKLKGFLKKEFDVSFPRECDAEMIRDGIDFRPTADSTLDSPLWLMQMISYVSPQSWEKKFQATPESLLASIASKETYALHLARGLYIATVLHQNRSWAKTFIKTDMVRSYEELIRILTPADCEEIFLSLLSANNGRLSMTGALEQRLFIILPLMQHAWSESFSNTIIKAVCAELSAGNRDNIWHLRSILHSMGTSLHPSLIDSDQAVNSFRRLGLTDPGEVQAVDKLFTILQFRKEIYS